MNTFELWFIRRVFAREVMQGTTHDRRIAALFALINEACESEFYEDNKATRRAYLHERLDAAIGA